MPLASARAYGSIAAFASVIALVSAASCSTEGGGIAPSDAGAPLTDVGTVPSDIGSLTEAGAVVDAGADGGDSRVEVAPFHVIGRFEVRDAAGPRFGWSGTEIRARFSGTGLSIELADTGVSHYDVSIDGAAPKLLIVTGGKQTYGVATGLAPGLHDVVLTKRTETFTGVTQLLGFAGTLVPSPVPNGRRIELVGDSITCGFGVLGPDETCPFTPATQSEALAWGAVAAKQLGALHMVTAVSGLGVLRNYDGATRETMPERYDRSLADDATSTWDHHAFVPDVIIVNLGTNDFAGGKGDPGPGFEAAYTKFLAALRATHPSARIVAATSPMLSGENHARHRAYVEGAIAARTSAGDSKLTLVDIDEQSGADGYGCAYHPSIATQKTMAAKLVAHVKPLMGW